MPRRDARRGCLDDFIKELGSGLFKEFDLDILDVTRSNLFIPLAFKDCKHVLPVALDGTTRRPWKIRHVAGV